MRRIASRDPIAFSPAEIVTTTMAIGGAGMRSAYEPWSSPACQTDTPPGIDRVAEPEPRRARRERSRSDRSSPYAAAAAVARAAKPEALDASPAPVGTVFTVSTWACVVEPARSRTSSRNCCARTRAPSGAAVPLSTRESAVAEPSSVTVVVVGKTSRPIDTLPVAGRASCASALPQYFTSAMLGCATAVAVIKRGLRSWWSRSPSRRRRGVRRPRGRRAPRPRRARGRIRRAHRR